MLYVKCVVMSKNNKNTIYRTIYYFEKEYQRCFLPYKPKYIAYSIFKFVERYLVLPLNSVIKFVPLSAITKIHFFHIYFREREGNITHNEFIKKSLCTDIFTFNRCPKLYLYQEYYSVRNYSSFS